MEKDNNKLYTQEERPMYDVECSWCDKPGIAIHDKGLILCEQCFEYFRAAKRGRELYD